MKKLPLIYAVASLCSYVAAFLFYTSNATLGTIWLLLGTTNLCLFITWKKKLEGNSAEDVHQEPAQVSPVESAGDAEPTEQAEDADGTGQD